MEVAGYRIVQEALTNALKHAPDASVRVRVSFGPQLLELEIDDDGSSNGIPGSGFGLVGMRERAEMYGGSLDVARAPGGAFRVRARFPIEDGSR